MDVWPSERAKLAIQVAERLAHGESPTPDAQYANGTVRIPVFYGPRRVISQDNVALMAKLWCNMYPE